MLNGLRHGGSSEYAAGHECLGLGESRQCERSAEAPVAYGAEKPDASGMQFRRDPAGAPKNPKP